MTDGGRAEQAWTPEAPRGVEAARRLVMLSLMLNVATATAVPLATVDVARPGQALVLATALLVHGVVHVLALQAAVAPGAGHSRRTELAWTLAVVAAAGSLPFFWWAEAGQEPWSWLAGATVGTSLVLLRPAGTVALALALLVVGSGVAHATRGNVWDTVLVYAVAAAATGVVSALVVWLLRLLFAAQAGSDARAGLAIAEERLRMARELHDLLGHRLVVIGLQAELLGADTIRELASSTLQDARELVHGEGTADLADQIRNGALILRSAGIQVEVEVDGSASTGLTANFLSAVVREAVTNILRHSDARTCRVNLFQRPAELVLVVANDGSRSRGALAAGMGLEGLAERAARLGATVAWELKDDRFTLTARAPS